MVSTSVSAVVLGGRIVDEPGVVESVAVVVATALTPTPRPACVGTTAHNTATASSAPIAPVAADRPRPIVSGGSLLTHAA